MECVPAVNVEIPPTVNASAAELRGTLLATVVVDPFTVSTKFIVPNGNRTPDGLTVACKNNVTGVVPLVNGAKFPPPIETNTLATLVLLALFTVTVTGVESLGANVPSPA